MEIHRLVSGFLLSFDRFPFLTSKRKKMVLSTAAKREGKGERQREIERLVYIERHRNRWGERERGYPVFGLCIFS